jgi:hypothetical protein
MKKLTLNVDHLRVESFEPVAGRAEKRGTVRGMDQEYTAEETCRYTCDASCRTCYDPSCAGTCRGATCAYGICIPF